MSAKTFVELYRAHAGKVSDKWSSYLPVYEEAFAPLRDRKVSLLEIGIQNGGSLEIYSKYFPSFEKLVGCDINPGCSKLSYQDPRIRVVVGDANTDEIETKILEISNAFDIILDDGSHTSADIIRSFARYWKHVRPGGIFVAEDLHCSYWQEYGGGLHDPLSSISFFKVLADVIHQEHWGLKGGPRNGLEKFARFYGLAFDDQELQAVHAVEFFNSLCIIRKELAEKNLLGQRILSGQESTVIPADASLQGSTAVSLDQSANAKAIDPWQLPETRLQLFFSSTATFSEAQSVGLSYICGDPQSVSLVLPKEAQVGNFLFLRLDPTDRPGLVLLREIRLQGRRIKGGKITNTFHAGDIVPAGDLLALPEPAGSYLSTGNDPSFLLAAVPTTGVAYESLEVEIGFQPESSALGVPIRSLQRSVLKQGEAVERLAQAVKEIDNRNREEMEKLAREIADFSEKQTLATHRLGEAHARQETRLRDLAVYLGAIQDLASSPWLNYLPIPLSWPLLLFKARELRRPQWFQRKQSGQPQRKPGFWRRLERSIRKRRNKLRAIWGFDAQWYLENNPDVRAAGLNPLAHYLQTGLQEERKKNASDQPSPTAKKEMDVTSYEMWIQKYENLTEKQRMDFLLETSRMGRPAKISILIPTYNSQIRWLELAIQSVMRQIYPHWELVVCDDGSDQPELREYLEKLPSRDPRIRIFFQKERGHISAACNRALAEATAEWAAVLDHDDELHEAALYHVAQAIQRHPGSALIYSDEDKITPEGRRFDPYFKSDFDRVLMWGQNMITHLAVIKTSVLREIGGFRKGFEGAQDYDLFLRISEQVTPDAICHIPRVLYHWRAHPQSTAMGAVTASGETAKPYALIASEKAVNDHLERTRMSFCVVADTKLHMHRLRPLPTSRRPKVSILIPTRNQGRLVANCVHSIFDSTKYNIDESSQGDQNFEVLLLDNGTDQKEDLRLFKCLEEKYPKFKKVCVPGSFNYSKINNQGVSLTSGELLCLLNNDTEVIEESWLRELAALAAVPWVGAVGAKLLFPDRTIQHAGVVTGIGGSAAHVLKGSPEESLGYFCRATLPSRFSAVTGACLMVKKADYLGVGGLDEEDFRVAFNDVDFCLKLEAKGKVNVLNPAAVLIHHESKSRGYEDNPQKKARFNLEKENLLAKWGQRIFEDPWYNSNLTHENIDYSLASEPRV